MKLRELLENNHYINGNDIEDIQEILQLLNTDYSEAWKAYKSAKCLYRGISGVTAKSFISDISDGERKSLHTNSIDSTDTIYNTLFSSKLKSWSTYPKRNKSVICTGNFNLAKNYGKAYHIFPINGTIIGKCPKFDLWYSFYDNIKIIGTNLLPKIFKKYSSVDEFDKHSYIYNDCISLTSFEDVFKLTQKHTSLSVDELLNAKVDGKKFIDHLDDLLSPENNDFSKIKINDVPNNDPKHEYWFSDNCLYVECNTEIMVKLLDADKS